MQPVFRKPLMAACAALVAMTMPAAASAATPIPAGPPTTLPSYVGSPATPKPINGVPNTAQNPFMAPNDVSSTHDDAWQMDTVRRSGPLGRNPVLTSNANPPLNGDCVSQAFDRRGRLISICAHPGSPAPALKMFDPVTLDQLTSTTLPNRPPPLCGIPT